MGGSGGKGGDLFLNPVYQLLSLRGTYIASLNHLLCLKPFKKFAVSGGELCWVVVDTTVDMLFCFRPRLELSLGPEAKFEQKVKENYNNVAICMYLQNCLLAFGGQKH